jgi:hypothetical protein
VEIIAMLQVQNNSLCLTISNNEKAIKENSQLKQQILVLEQKDSDIFVKTLSNEHQSMILNEQRRIEHMHMMEKRSLILKYTNDADNEIRSVLTQFKNQSDIIYTLQSKLSLSEKEILRYQDDLNISAVSAVSLENNIKTTDCLVVRLKEEAIENVSLIVKYTGELQELREMCKMSADSLISLENNIQITNTLVVRLQDESIEKDKSIVKYTGELQKLRELSNTTERQLRQSLESAQNKHNVVERDIYLSDSSQQSLQYASNMIIRQLKALQEKVSEKDNKLRLVSESLIKKDDLLKIVSEKYNFAVLELRSKKEDVELSKRELEESKMVMQAEISKIRVDYHELSSKLRNSLKDCVGLKNQLRIMDFLNDTSNDKNSRKLKSLQAKNTDQISKIAEYKKSIFRLSSKIRDNGASKELDDKKKDLSKSSQLVQHSRSDIKTQSPLKGDNLVLPVKSIDPSSDLVCQDSPHSLLLAYEKMIKVLQTKEKEYQRFLLVFSFNVRKIGKPLNVLILRNEG